MFTSRFKFSKNKKTEIIENIKELKNLGSQINNVTLIRNNWLKEDINVGDGILFHYNIGGVCISDPNKRYETYLYLKCDKESTTSTPRYIRKSIGSLLL